MTLACIQRGIPHRSIDFSSLWACFEELREGDVLPVGSVEFVREAMWVADVDEPPNETYPVALYPWLRRRLTLCPAAYARRNFQQHFVKPVSTKRFTGFCVEDSGKSDWHQEQWAVFCSLPAEELVYVFPVVRWASEFRFYIQGGKVIGHARYDEGEDGGENPPADVTLVTKHMVATYGRQTPYALDVGVLSSGEVALVEVNDAWALGFYKGTLSPAAYLDFLWERWRSLVASRIPMP